MIPMNAEDMLSLRAMALNTAVKKSVDTNDERLILMRAHKYLAFLQGAETSRGDK